MPPTIGKKAINIASVCPSVMYIANNSGTERPSMLKFGRKIPCLRCDSTPASRSNSQKSGLDAGGGVPCWPNPTSTLLV